MFVIIPPVTLNWIRGRNIMFACVFAWMDSCACSSWAMAMLRFGVVSNEKLTLYKCKNSKGLKPPLWHKIIDLLNPRLDHLNVFWPVALN